MKKKKTAKLPEFPDAALKYQAVVSDAQEQGLPHPTVPMEQVFSGAEYAGVRSQLAAGEVVRFRTKKGEEMAVIADVVDKDMFAMAAAIPRTPGRSEDFVQKVTDFTNSNMKRTDKIDLFHRVYRAEGMFSSGINKYASLIATRGSFKVRYVRGKPGKGSDTRIRELQTLLQYWQENVNGNAEDGVVTGSKGIQSFINRGARQSFIEGDHFARQNWDKAKVPALGNKAYSLPLNLQSFSSKHIEIPAELQGMLDIMYWVPPREFVRTLQNPKDKNLKVYLDELVPSEIQSALIKDGKYLLDPALMIHIKHRGIDTDAYGESILESAMSELAYKRALQALDMVTIENLINRLVIVKVGSDNENSVYHKSEVSQRRLQLLQRLFQNVGPSSTILWAGPDLSIEEVGAHDAILDVNERYKQVQERMQLAIGASSAIMSGSTDGGKAAGWASIMATAAQLGELQNEYTQMLTQIGHRIAAENNFEDVDLVWTFHLDLLANKTENADLVIKQYGLGLIDEETALEELGYSYEAMEGRMQQSVDKGYRDEPFGPPRGQLTTNETGEGGETGGRPKNTGKPDPRKNKEKQSPEENK